MFTAYKTWRQKRRARFIYQDLSIVDDQLLADLGLTRADLEAARSNHNATYEGQVFP
jgi:uncharacterized protein YjiS (DUF1127 family)